MLYLCIPAYNEAETVGVLLWRIRKVFQDYSREYEVLVFDDGSTDATRDTLEPYTRVLPLTILGGPVKVGYAAAMDALLREASARTRYPRRDALVTMQGDFTDQPESLPELVKRFEGGADIVVGEHDYKQYPKGPERNLRRVAPWIIRPFVRVPGVADPFSTLRLYRVSVVRDLLKSLGDGRLIANDGWAGNVELLLRTAPLARRIETAPLEARHDLRTRESRVRPWAVARDLYRFGRSARTIAPQPRREAAQAP
ncbi:MAG TPA: glycosyltransferase family 2 protein [Gemmatimonadaceae bacterium]|nr:glycosyltransferase family 2 protein [Gemmatimonadaceae bacterium]